MAKRLNQDGGENPDATAEVLRALQEIMAAGDPFVLILSGRGKTRIACGGGQEYSAWASLFGGAKAAIARITEQIAESAPDPEEFRLMVSAYQALDEETGGRSTGKILRRDPPTEGGTTRV